METIVLATDGSPSAEPAVAQAIGIASATGARLVVACVEDLGIRAPLEDAARATEELRALESARVEAVLERVAALAEEQDVPTEKAHLGGPVAEELCAEASRQDASLIVVGTHGWGALGRVLHGSVSSEVLHRAPCSVLVARAPAGLPA